MLSGRLCCSSVSYSINKAGMPVWLYPYRSAVTSTNSGCTKTVTSGMNPSVSDSAGEGEEDSDGVELDGGEEDEEEEKEEEEKEEHAEEVGLIPGALR